MSPAIIDLKNNEDPRDVVHRAVQALAEGQLVAFPTETVYGIAASAFQPGAVERLKTVKGRDPKRPVTLAIKSCDDALDYVPNISKLGMRLARRCWPGPLTLVLDDNHPDSVVHRLPASVRDSIIQNGKIGLRVPAHDIILAAMRLTAGPLVLSSANLSGQPDSVNAAQVEAALNDDIAMIVDDGLCKFAQPSSVVQVCDDRLEILREGVLDKRAIHQLSSFLVLIVCTGNTCRSPMGEMLLKKRLAEHLGCRVDQLEAQGVIVVSAGIAAIPGSRASPEAVDLMASLGLDLSGHASQPVTDRLVRHADAILTMTRGHRGALLAEWPSAAPRTHVISRNREDIADPIGGPPELYQRCAAQIDHHLAEWVKEFQLKSREDS